MRETTGWDGAWDEEAEADEGRLSAPLTRTEPSWLEGLAARLWLVEGLGAGVAATLVVAIQQGVVAWWVVVVPLLLLVAVPWLAVLGLHLAACGLLWPVATVAAVTTLAVLVGGWAAAEVVLTALLVIGAVWLLAR